MANDSFNWIVPLRRAVVKKPAKYREFMADWLDELRVDDHAYVLGIWYADDDDEPFTPDGYNKGLASLNHWWKRTFAEARVATASVATTTIQTKLPNYHARFWKGPKRILREQAAAGDPEKLAKLQPFDLVDGRIRLQRDAAQKVKEIELLPGDVLEVPLHLFLSVCGQKRFEDVVFDPKGSFYLGTTVRSKSGKPRTEIPLLHDNMLAMRFQLLTALNLGNCCHDEPVYASMRVPAHALKPEGAGVFARGMPFGGNAASPLRGSASSPYWQIYQLNTNLPNAELPLYIPTWGGLQELAKQQPVTWGWTCSPFALFFFTFMADAHKTSSGLRLPGGFRKGSLAESICMSALSSNNKKMIQAIQQFQADNANDPLLLHNLQLTDIILPREQTPLADLCEIVLPTHVQPKRDVFTDPNGDRIRRIPHPEPGHVVTSDWNEICPGAGIVVQSSGAGHEFGLVKLYPLHKIMSDAVTALAEGAAPDELIMPVAGRLGAYNPLSGEDYCSQPGINPNGHFFINEASAPMPPKERGYYSRHMAMSDVNIHKFRYTLDNRVQFAADGQKLLINDEHEDAAKLNPEPGQKKKKKKKKKKKGEDDEGEDSDDKMKGFRKRHVSGIFFISEGTEGDPDPRTLSNIYRIRREAWPAISVRLPDPHGPDEIADFLADFPRLYAERAVPFPTLLEVAPGLPSWARVFQQMVNHRERILDLQNQVSKIRIELWRRMGEISAYNKKVEEENMKKKKDDRVKPINPKRDKTLNEIKGRLKLATDPAVRKKFLDHLPPKESLP